MKREDNTTCNFACYTRCMVVLLATVVVVMVDGRDRRRGLRNRSSS